MPWRIDDEQLATLRRARETRPPPLAARDIFILVIVFLFVPIGLIAFASTPPLGGASVALLIGSSALWGRRLTRAGRAWREAFRPWQGSMGRQVARIMGGEGAPLLRYQMIRDKPEWEWLTIEAGTRIDVRVESRATPIGDAAFDGALGLTGTLLQQALLGPQLRINAARWHADAGFVIVDGQAKLKLGAHGYDDPDTLQAICVAFGDYVDRLTALPELALVDLARDAAHPFDAARALATLAIEGPSEAEAVEAELSATPIGAALARVALTGDGLDDPALDWPTRSAIGRGVLGVRCAAAVMVARWIEFQAPIDDASAMALVDLADATTLPALAEPGGHRPAMEWIIEQGGPACLPWMRERAARDRHARADLQRLSARLEGAHAGFLALDEAERAGGLTEVRSGELSLAGEAVPPQ